MASSEQLMVGTSGGHRYVQMQSEPSTPPQHQHQNQQPSSMMSSLFSFAQGVTSESSWIFDELPTATIVSVSRPDSGDISPVLLSYTFEVQYKQFKWQLVKKAAQVFYLHFALKRRAFFEEIHEKQEQVKEWLQNLGIGDHAPVVHDEDEPDDDTIPLHTDESAKNRNVPSSAALPVIRPALGRQHSVSARAKEAMQEYLNHFLGNLDIVNSREVCKFLEVSNLSFCPEYGSKLKQDYVMAKHLPKIPKKDDSGKCCACHWLSCCNDNWQKLWDIISNQEAVQIVSSTSDRQKSAKQLVRCAVHAWKYKKRGIAMDNISAICLFFHDSPSQYADSFMAFKNKQK